jgi:hypothetical protein
VKRNVRFEDEHLLFRWRDPTKLPIVHETSVAQSASAPGSRVSRPSSPMVSSNALPARPQAVRPVVASAVAPGGGASGTAAVVSPSASAPPVSEKSVVVAQNVPAVSASSKKLSSVTSEKSSSTGKTKYLAPGAAVACGLAFFFGGFPVLQIALWMVNAAFVWLVFGEVKKVRQQLNDLEAAVTAVRQVQQAPTAFAVREVPVPALEVVAEAVVEVIAHVFFVSNVLFFFLFFLKKKKKKADS